MKNLSNITLQNIKEHQPIDTNNLFYLIKSNAFHKKLKEISLKPQHYNQNIGQAEFEVRVKSLGDMLAFKVKTTLIVYPD